MTNAEIIAWQNRVQSPVEKALRRAFALGQTYWQQADSESYSQNRKSDDTLVKFEALLASMQAEAPPEGWKLVPVEPTLEMCLAEWNVSMSDAHSETGTSEAAWRAMLNAAPEAPQATKDAVFMPTEPTPAMLYAMWQHRHYMTGQSENEIAREGYRALRIAARKSQGEAP